MSKFSAELTDQQGNKGILTLETLNDRLEQLENIKVKNGEEKIIPLPQAVAEIWEASEVLRDFNKINKIAKKYPRLTKLFKSSLVMIFLMQLIRWGIDYKDWFLTLVKTL